MSVKSYYRLALALPLLVPALASPLMLLDTAPQGLRMVMFLLYWSVIIGGLPYLLFAAGFLVWMRHRSEARVRIGILLSPLVYAAVLLACFTLFLLADGTLSSGSRDSAGGIVLFGVLIGYAYVALAELGRALLRPGAAPAVPVPAVPAS